MSSVDEWAESIEPVFIVGPARSGTTVMYRTLVEAPGFWSLRGTYETRAFVPGHLERPALREPAKIVLGTRHDAFLAEREALSGRSLVRQYFWEASLNHGPGRVLEKTPEHVFRIPGIIDAFPKASVVMMLRPAAGVVASHRSRLQRELANGRPIEEVRWLATPIEEMLDLLQRTDKAIGEALAAYPDHMAPVSYERLTENTADELAAVGAKLRMTEVQISKMIANAMRVRKNSGKGADASALASPLGKTNRPSNVLTAAEEAAIAATTFTHL